MLIFMDLQMEESHDVPSLKIIFLLPEVKLRVF